MTTILALESSASACSVALCHGGQIYTRQSLLPREHTRRLLPMVDEVLEAAGLNIAAVEALAFSSGPGSFTGLRIAFGIVQGLAFARNTPVIPVPTLEALALAACGHFSLIPGDLILSALDARKSEIYWGLYRVSGVSAEAVTAERINEVSAAAEIMVAEPIAAGVGDGWHYASAIPVHPDQVEAGFVLPAEAVLAAAITQFEAGKILAVDDAELNYLRNEVAWKKRERLSVSEK